MDEVRLILGYGDAADRLGHSAGDASPLPGGGSTPTRRDPGSWSRCWPPRPPRMVRHRSRGDARPVQGGAGPARQGHRSPAP